MTTTRTATRKNIYKLGVLLILLALISTGSALAAGALDPTFGANGVVTTAVNDYAGAYAMLVQSDGKIVLAGSNSNGGSFDFTLIRYTSAGALDTSFGSGGIVTTDFSGGDSWINAAALQSDGKIVAVGAFTDGSDDEFAVARYNSNGTLDTTFSGDGKLTTDFVGTQDWALSVAVQSDGKIVVAGYTDNGSSGGDFAVARYTSAGALDTTFSGDGKLLTDFNGGSDYGKAVAIQSDGKIVVGGYARNDWYTDVFALARYNSNGTPDTSFGDNGLVESDISIYGAMASSMLIQPDGKIVLAGYSNNGDDWDITLARYTSAGDLDTTFSSTGYVATPVGEDDRAFAIARQADGKLIVTGYAYDSTNGQVVPLLRYNTNGTLDTGFGINGIATFTFGGWDTAYALAVQSDGKLLVAGTDAYNFALARFDPSLTLAAPSGLTATAAGQTQVNLAWNDNSANESGFEVQRSPGGANAWAVISTTAANVETYADTSALCGNTYDYRLFAFNTELATRSSASNVASVSTAACNPPGVFGKINPANGADEQLGSLTLSWGSSATAVRYEYCYDVVNDHACSYWYDNGSATTAALTGLSLSTTYYWQVRAINPGNTTYANGSSTAYWSFTTGNPGAGEDGVWGETGGLNTPRISHTATLLPNGKVLVAGGVGYVGEELGQLTSAEIYDPAAGAWAPTDSLNEARSVHTATLLPNGKVLVAGGDTASAELYDPATGLWTNTGTMLHERYGHTATLLPNGKVLVVGGDGGLGTAELYNPATGTWVATGSMGQTRAYHTATLLPNGKVLVAGGSSGSTNPLASAEIYDPATGLWSSTDAMEDARYAHTDTLLPDGRVLVAGGYQGDHSTLRTAEVYNPATGLWSYTGWMEPWRYDHAAILLPNGKVLVAGGYNILDGIMETAEVYNPATGNWAFTTPMNFARHIQTFTLLNDGRVLAAGGSNADGLVRAAELYYTPGPSLQRTYLPGILR